MSSFFAPAGSMNLLAERDVIPLIVQPSGQTEIRCRVEPDKRLQALGSSRSNFPR